MSKLKRTAIFITLLALVLKLSGFLRESIISRQFGATNYTDGYLLAFTFITLVIAIISGGFNNVFLPLYVKLKKEQPERTERDAVGIMNSTILLFLIITAVFYFLLPSIVPLIYGNMTPTTKHVAIEISQFFLLFMFAIALSGILDSYLQGRRIFVPSQVSKLIATLMGAVFALLFSGKWGINSLAYGFIFGTLLGAIIQFYYLLKSGFRWTPTFKVHKEFRVAFLVPLLPSLLNSLAGQINMFIDKSFASGTFQGAVTYLNNASLIVSIPSAIYATTIAAIIFTLLSERINDRPKFQQTVFMGMELSLVTLLPIAVGLVLVGDQVISFIYEGGAFTAEDTHKTYIALLLYTPMIVAQGLQYIVSKSMYARGKTAVIMRIGLTTIALNFILNYILVKTMSYAGLALSSSIVAIYYLLSTTFAVYKDFDRSEVTRLIRLFLRSIPPVLIMGIPVYLIKNYTGINDWYSLWQLAVTVPVGVILYVVGLYIFYRPGFNRLIEIVKRKRKK